MVHEIRQTQNKRFVAELYDRYSQKIYRKCLSFVKRTSKAEDLTHDIFVKVLLSLSTFKGNSKVSTWIYAITYNFCVDYLRKEKKLNFHHNEFKTGDNDNYDEEDDLQDLQFMRAERLKEILEKIKTDEKMILLMKYQDNFSIKQIQEILGISESATKMRLKRAKEKVKKIYLSTYKNY